MSRYFRAGSGRSRARARHSLAVTFAAALLQLPAGIAAAQDTASAPDTSTTSASSGATKLDAVMVKGQAQGYVSDEAHAATKTDTPLAETPQSISVVTREQLDAQQVVSLSEALRYTAGVNTQPYGSDNRYNWYSIRGFSANDYTFQDGLRLVSGYFMQPAPDPYGFESVEIVRGPSSVLYGQGSPGGLVNIDSKLPTQTRGGNAGLMFGNYDLREAYADSSGPITGDGRLSYRLTALGKLSDTQVEGAGNNRMLIAPALTWKPFDGTRITFLGNYQDDDTSGVNSGTYSPALQQTLLAVGQQLYGKSDPINPISPSANFGVPGDDLERASSSIGYLLDQRIDDVWSLHQGVRLNHTGGFYKYTGLVGVVFPSPADAVGVANYPYILTRQAIHYDEQLNSAVVDTHGQAKWSWGKFQNTAIAGVDYQYLWNHYVGLEGPAATVDIRNPDASPPPPDAETQNVNVITRGTQVGFYGQAQTKYDRRWVGLVSLRRDWAPYQYQDNLAGTNSHLNDHQWTYRVGAAYLGDYGLNPYISYATSFQPTPGTVTSTGAPFKPTEGRNFETGLRWQPQNGKVSVTVSAFAIHNKNVTQADAQNPGQQTQAGEIRSRGFEVESTARLFRDLDLIAAYTYLDAKITQSTDLNLGKRPQNVPRNSASLWADYKLPALMPGLGFAAGVRYVGNVVDYTSTYVTPSVTLLDTSVHYDWRTWRLSVNLANAFNRTYLSNCGSELCNYGDPRTIRGAVTYAW